MMAHINEHLGFQYRVEIENQLGFNLLPQVDESGEDTHIDPETEARLAPMLSMAAQRLLQQSQQQAQAAQAQQQAQDPIIQMQQQELQIKAQEQQRKAQKDQADIALKNKQLQIDALKTVATMQNQQRNEAANRNMDALKTVATLQSENMHKKKDRALDLLKHEDILNKPQPKPRGE